MRQTHGVLAAERHVEGGDVNKARDVEVAILLRTRSNAIGVPQRVGESVIFKLRMIPTDDQRSQSLCVMQKFA